ncbi:MAG: T9SS type A sorting domain-containing protein [Bacteroidota bacterium]
MKHVATSATALVLSVLLSAAAFAQATGDYRSNGTGGGAWNAASSWQRYSGTSWVAAAAPPTGSELITVRSTDSVYVNAAVSVTGTLQNQGKLGGASNLTIASGGVFRHDQDGGSIPRATWAAGSTLLLTGVTSAAPDNRSQSFHHVTFDTPGLLANLNMAWDSITIGGDIRVLNTGSSRWYMTTALAGDSSVFTIMGDVIVSGGNFSTNGTGNANTRFVVHHYGDVLVTGGNLSISRGSQGSGTGSTRWYLHEGDFSMSGATTQNSNPTNAWFVFDKAGTQTLTLGAGNTLTSLPIQVASGTTLEMGMSEVRGSGLFTLSPGAVLATGNEGGVDSAVSVTGTVSFSTEAGFTFNGTVPQVTGVSMPATVQNLTINNAAGVALTQPTTINGVLRLMAGVFNNTIPFTLGPSGSISYEGGSLLFPVSVEAGDGGVPAEFFVEQNYPNPFNPTTEIRFGIPSALRVRAEIFTLLGERAATLVDEVLEPGVHVIRLDATGLGSGVYLYRIQAGSRSSTHRMVLVK